MAEAPAKAKRPARDLGIRSATCQALTMARRYGWTIAIGKDDISCPLTKVAFGLEPAPPFFDEGGCAEGMYVESRAAGARTERELPRLAPGAFQGIAFAPLARADFEPDVICIYGTPGQVLRLLCAALWKRGGYLTSRFSGRLDCADVTIETVRTGECQVILPCYGDRIFGQAEDHEMGFSVPRARLDELLAGLEGTHKGGIRYPIPTWLRYEAKFPENYEKLSDHWKAERP